MGTTLGPWHPGVTTRIMTHPETTAPKGQLEEWRVFCFEKEKVRRDVRTVFKPVKGISVSQNRNLMEGNTMSFTFWFQSSSQASPSLSMLQTQWHYSSPRMLCLFPPDCLWSPHFFLPSALGNSHSSFKNQNLCVLLLCTQYTLCAPFWYFLLYYTMNFCLCVWPTNIRSYSRIIIMSYYLFERVVSKRAAWRGGYCLWHVCTYTYMSRN